MQRAKLTSWIALGLALAALAAAGVFGLRRGGNGRSAEDAVRNEAAAWSARWIEARGCLLGAAPPSSDGREALLLRAASQPDIGAHLARCADGVRQLELGPRPGGASAAVEAAWYDLAQAAPTVNLFHEPKRLAKAIGDTDAALRALRDQLGLPPVPAWPGPAALPVAPAGLVISDAGHPLIPESVEVDNDVLVVTSRSDRQTIVAYMTSPSALTLYRAAADQVRASAGDQPGQTDWGVFAEPGPDGHALFAAPFAPRGATAGPRVAVRREPSPPTVGLEPLFASGSGQARVVAYRQLTHDQAGEPSSAVAVDHSTDGGASWQRALEVNGALRPALELDLARGRLSAVWNEPDGALQWLEVGPGAKRQVARPPEASADARDARRCFGASSSWWFVNGRLYHRELDSNARGDRPLEGFTLAQPSLVCSDDRLIATQLSGGRLAIELCDPSSCRPIAPLPAPEGSQARQALTARGAIVALAAYDLLLLWTEGETELEPIMRLPGDATLHGLVVWRNLVYAVLQDAARIRVVQVGDFGG